MLQTQLLSKYAEPILWIIGVAFLLLLACFVPAHAVGWFTRLFVLPGWIAVIALQTGLWSEILQLFQGGIRGETIATADSAEGDYAPTPAEEKDREDC